MFVLMVYDAGVKRVGPILKTARRYLNWVQNSVLEGEITQGKLKALKRDLAEVIKPEYDSVIFYIWRTESYAAREIMGVEREARGNFV